MLRLLISLILVASSCSTAVSEVADDNPLLPGKNAREHRRGKKPYRNLMLDFLKSSQLLMTASDFFLQETGFIEESDEGKYLNNEFHPYFNLCSQQEDEIYEILKNIREDNLTINWCNGSKIFENPRFYRLLERINHLAILNMPYSGKEVGPVVDMLSRTSVNIHLDFYGMDDEFLNDLEKKNDAINLFKKLSEVRQLKSLTLSLNSNAQEILKYFFNVPFVENLILMVGVYYGGPTNFDPIVKWAAGFKNLKTFRLVGPDNQDVKLNFSIIKNLPFLEVFIYREGGNDHTPFTAFHDISKMKYVIIENPEMIKNLKSQNNIEYAVINKIDDAQIPAALGKLKNIVHLEIKSDNKTDLAIKYLRNLKKLRSLQVFTEKLDQETMKYLLKIRNLQYLYINTRKSEGKIDLGYHSKIKSLSINFQKGCEHHLVLNKVPQLKYLYLSGTENSGELFLDMKSPARLEKVDIFKFVFTRKSLNFWKKQRNLKSIKLNESSVISEIVSEILSLPELERINIKGNYEAEGYYESLLDKPFRCSKLKIFNIGYFNFGNNFMSSISKCRNFEKVRIYDVNRKGAREVSFSAESEIKDLSLTNMEFKNLKNLSVLRKLKKLSLKNVQLEKIEKLEFLNRIIELDLTNNSLKMTEIEKLKDLKNLKNLSVKYNSLSDDEIKDLSNKFSKDVKLDIRD